MDGAQAHVLSSAPGAVAAPRDARIPGSLSAEKTTRQTITSIRRWTDHLFSFRITRDRAYRFKPGQFARLGVYRDDDHGNRRGPRFVWRAYSIVSADYDETLEFYSIVVPDGDFTTQLASLRVGDELLIEKQSYGFLTLDRFEYGRDLWLLCSGTGIAPFISILYDLGAWEQYQRLVLVHSVRRTNELAYRDTIEAFRSSEVFGEELAANPGKLVYVPIVTREKPDGALGARIPALLSSGALEARAGMKLDHEKSRIMICGNPDMVDDIRKHLTHAGYAVSRRGQPAQMAVENYW
jgi:ferredoxin--NADP+ reductase